MANSSSKIPKAADYALQIMGPILASLEGEAGELPEEFWQDAFVLGFTGFVIEGHSNISRSRSERGFLLSHVYNALSNLNGTAIARRYIELESAVQRSADFENGYENAVACMRSFAEGTDESDRLFCQPVRERLSIHNDATEVSDVKAQADAQEGGVVLPLSESKERLGKRRSPSTARSDSSIPQTTEERPADFDFSEFEEASRQIAALEIQVRELRRRGDNWQKAAQAAALGQQKLHALEADVQKLRDERESSVSKAKASQAAFDDASKQLASLRGDFNTLRKERDAWENEAREARAAGEDARQRSVALSAELDSLRDERDQLAEADAAVAELQEQVSNLESDLDRLRNERDRWAAKAEALEADLEALRDERDDWEAEAHAARAAIDDVRHDDLALSAELDRLRDRYDRLNDRAEAAEATVEKIHQHEAKLEAELDRLHIERDRWVEKAKAGQRALLDRAADARASRRRKIAIMIIFYAVVISLIAYFGISQFANLF